MRENRIDDNRGECRSSGARLLRYSVNLPHE
jgi:hypothetical protein